MSKIELHIQPKNLWLTQDVPCIISGPCSVESPEQIRDTAKKLSQNSRVSTLRGGIWKPRTRPNSFEGVGEIGLKWLKEAGDEVGLPVATEVATSRHVELCLKHNIDVLWIGARTTVNPFSVQEIAEVLKGTDIPVLIKNPINPDINLWIGAIERINSVGITKIGAIHRGFSSFDKTAYRNAPMWEIPIELKMLCPELPILCDPSHISGNRELIKSISQKALDLELDGLMIETHFNPEIALSDAKQQLTPHQLSIVLSQLTFRDKQSSNENVVNRLEQLRQVIDELDEDLLNKFASRMDVIEKIGKYKKENNITILQLDRWEQTLKNRLFIAEKAGLNADFTKKLLELVHQESIRIQVEVMNETNPKAAIKISDKNFE